jgi:outer membrane protein TolC
MAMNVASPEPGGRPFPPWPRPSRAFAAITLFAAVFAGLAAEEPKAIVTSISVDEAATRALAADEGLKRAAASLEGKRRSVGLGWSGFMPSIAASAGLAGSARPLVSSDVAVSASASATAALSLSHSLPDDLKLRRISYERELLAYEKAAARVELAARKGFYLVLLDRERLRAARQNVERQEASYARIEAKYKAGLAPELDLLSAKAALESLRPVVDSYATNLANDLDSLALALGLESVTEQDLAGSLDLGDSALDRLLSEASRADPSAGRDVQDARKALEAAEATERQTRSSDFLPTYTLSASVAPSLPIVGSSAASSLDLNASLAASANIRLDNFLPGSAAREKLSAAKDGVSSAKSTLREAERSSASALRSAERNLGSSRSSLVSLRLNVDLAKRVLASTEDAYARGLASLSSLQDAESGMATASLNLLAKSFDLISAALDLANETGLPLESIGRL